MRKSDWPWVTLGEACHVVNGTTPRSTEPSYWGGDIVWITPADFGTDSGAITNSRRTITTAGFESCGLTMVPPGSVIVSSRAPIGNLGVAAVPLCFNQGCKALVPTDRVDSAYLYFAILHAVPDLQAMGSGATFSEISKSKIAKFHIPLPPLPEQRVIAGRLTVQMEQVTAARTAAQARLTAIDALPGVLLREVFGD